MIEFIMMLNRKELVRDEQKLFRDVPEALAW